MTDLLARTAALVDVASVSFAEAELASMVEAELAACPWLVVDRVADNVVARTQLGRSTRLVLAGHLDTVPANGNATARVEGDTLWGLGSTDMKGGLAVMLELATTVPEPVVDVTYVFYAAEEVAAEHNGLKHLFATRPDLLAGDVALLGEPTDAAIEAGCQGSLRVELVLTGARAHPARPWMGRNAIHRLGPVLDLIAAAPERRPVLAGCEYREAIQAVGVHGGVATNVVPDEATLVINHRFAPDRTAAEAEAALRALVAPALEPADRWTLVDAADASPPAVDHPLIATLIDRNQLAVTAKLGWTDVARFAAHGIPAANFGPGDPILAHNADERLHRSSIERCFVALSDLLQHA